ncbi:hypothetical protein BGZ76_010197, partial [Entomortierella beljakovae]
MNVVGLHMPQQGTILPGTTIQLGRYTVVIDRYIAEGGFAHVYLATLASGGGFPLVVKRIAVADKERLAIVQKEIDIMKCLGKHKNIVEYMDSCMGKLEGGGYEVLILMEYCGGGPVIDLMNRRLQHRLTEPEILKIFSNVCEAVAYLHYCDQPILHRDIKVENILLSNNDYKLCDFGSATTNILRGDNIPRNVKDIQLLEEEINNHTTLQYRAPEMLDLYMRRGIDEKIDIWALGVLLYKLCYYTTPFEEQGQLAILNVRYTIPEHPVFSPGLIGIIKSILKEDPRQRPNIYQLMKVTSSLRGLPCPIQNKYPDTPIPTTQEFQPSATANIFSNAALTRPVDALPSIEPMRRGRPTRPQAGATPPTQSLNNGFQSPPQIDSSTGFDDSFGQFTKASDPASQFSKIPSGDGFDFGDSFDSGKKSDPKRFTLDFEPDADEFGFKFSDSKSSNSSVTKPRPPSIGSNDLLGPENKFSSAHSNNNNKTTMPKQLSGTNNSSGATNAKPTANDLFFGSTAGIKLENGDKGSRPGTPSSFGSFQQAPIGLSSPPSNFGSESSGMTKPLLPTRHGNHQSTQSSLAPKPNNTYQPGSGSPGVPIGTPSISPALEVAPRTSSAGKGITGAESQEQPMTAAESMELLQRRQMEQLGKFRLNSNSPVSTNSLGKAKVLDPSKTLDGLKSQNVASSKPASYTGPTVPAVSAAPALAPRPQIPSSSIGASIIPGSAKEIKPLDRKALVQRDYEAEMKLIQLQQQDFERQQQELFKLQRQELENQQRQHREQHEKLQRQQQQKLQQQHEKWQERKRMLEEQDQLTQSQQLQQKDLEKQHEIQKQQQQKQQQQQQHPFPSPTGSSSSSSSAVPSSLQQQKQSNPYRMSMSNNGDLQSSAIPLSTGSTNDQLVPNFTSPVLQSSPAIQNTFSTGPSVVPTAPPKAARRNVANGAEASPGAPPKARRTSMVGALPPGQKPELLPKPTRFRMKDGVGTIAVGEEEAFKKRFPTAEIEDDLIQLEQELNSSSISSPATNAINTKNNIDDSLIGSGYSRESPIAARDQYMSPSQRARANRHIIRDEEDEEEEEEEEETLVRSRRRQYNLEWRSKPTNRSITIHT